ncbi:thioredoxin family protein [Desulforhopalus singaporensis]|uniref:Small redox-active disulfide protein 2 n=1 Tax=Desulforhopalus singaporensis TaxID=91360 RepID=A0A1H0L3V7_9BACT|nr:thioredoxin family protein [Desulforhopalus singaporensis]SDO62742.1 small redox-active disulfide protein 2 [Desulforhopalus singaporensis]
MDIKVCGPGCAKCHEAERLVSEAVKEAGVEATIEKVTDFNAIAGYGVFSTPAVIVDGEVKCVGKVPTKKEIRKWIG